ncbi:MAG TPA: hypothetical protein EYP65_07135, partial [Armatimonadetes bacterium]|nr:hypothetical protein [Armatimonadota bacterium]
MALMPLGVALNLLVLALPGLTVGLEGWLPSLLPLKSSPSPRRLEPTQLRGKHLLFLYAPRKGERLRLKVRGVQIGRYESPISVRCPSVPGAALTLQPGEEGRLEFEAPKRGIVVVELFTGPNAAVVFAEPPCAWLSLEASEQSPLHVISVVGRLFFFVPEGASRFSVHARGS